MAKKVSKYLEQPIHKTLADAKAARPEGNAFKLFEVKKGEETVGFRWAASAAGTLAAVAYDQGYSAKIAEGVISREAMKSKVMQMTDAEWKELVAARKAAR
jgi:hypothetical protein